MEKVKRIKTKTVVGGKAEGIALLSLQPITFFGGVDPNTGKVVEGGHVIEGNRISGKILIFPYGKGSTVGSYVLYCLAKRRAAPAAIINTKFDAIVASGCIIAGIPLVVAPESLLRQVKSGNNVRIDGKWVHFC